MTSTAFVRLNRQPGTFVLLELYRDAEALAADQTNAALARFGPALEPLTESMEVRLGTVLDLASRSCQSLAEHAPRCGCGGNGDLGMSERVFERANQHYGLLAHWCHVRSHELKASRDSMVHQ